MGKFKKFAQNSKPSSLFSGVQSSSQFYIHQFVD